MIWKSNKLIFFYLVAIYEKNYVTLGDFEEKAGIQFIKVCIYNPLSDIG